MSVLVDTLAARQGLVAAGIEPAQAEAIVGAFAHTGEQVATKADIQRLETEIAGATTGLKAEIVGVNTRTDGLKTEIAGVKTELKAEIAGVKMQVAALETKLEAKIDAKISAAANRLLAALVAVGGLLYAALRIF